MFLNSWGPYKRRILPLMATLLLLLLGWLVYTRGPLAPARVQTTSVQVGDLQPQIFSIGTVEARSLYTVGPTQAGRLANLSVEGDKVLVGQVVAEMEPVDLEGKVRSAIAGNQRAQSLALVAEMQLRETQSKRDLAQIRLERYQELFANNAISREILDGIENDRKVTQAALEAANFSLQAAQLAVEGTAADYQAVVKQRENLKIISPINGIIVSPIELKEGMKVRVEDKL